MSKMKPTLTFVEIRNVTPQNGFNTVDMMLNPLQFGPLVRSIKIGVPDSLHIKFLFLPEMGVLGSQAITKTKSLLFLEYPNFEDDFLMFSWTK